MFRRRLLCKLSENFESKVSFENLITFQEAFDSFWNSYLVLKIEISFESFQFFFNFLIVLWEIFLNSTLQFNQKWDFFGEATFPRLAKDRPVMPGQKQKRNALIYHVAVMLCECHVNVIQFVIAKKEKLMTELCGGVGWLERHGETIKLIASNFLFYCRRTKAKRAKWHDFCNNWSCATKRGEETEYWLPKWIISHCSLPFFYNALLSLLFDGRAAREIQSRFEATWVENLRLGITLVSESEERGSSDESWRLSWDCLHDW